MADHKQSFDAVAWGQAVQNYQEQQKEKQQEQSLKLVAEAEAAIKQAAAQGQSVASVDVTSLSEPVILFAQGWFSRLPAPIATKVGKVQERHSYRNEEEMVSATKLYLAIHAYELPA